MRPVFTEEARNHFHDLTFTAVAFDLSVLSISGAVNSASTCES